MATPLAAAVASAGLSQRNIATTLGISPAAVNNIIKHGQWPAKNTKELQSSFAKLLEQHGATKAAAQAAITQTTNKDTDMTTLRKQELTPETRRAFSITRDPFADDVTQEGVFLSPSIRFVRESMYQTAKHGGLMAVIGESGSGKSTLRKDLAARIKTEDAPIILIEPFVLGMEDNDRHGKTLKALHLAEAILFTVAPAQKCQSSPEARYRQVYKILSASHQAGNRHVLLIEEAHGLPYATLKHLKRFYELESGFDRLLSIILIGQPELKDKLGDAAAEVREVVARCEVVEVHPLDDPQAYIEHRCKTVGVNADALFAPDAYDVIPAKLSGPAAKGSGRAVSKVHPLAINNLCKAAMNAAVRLGETRVTADVILAL